jgi:hypothetical protein
MELLSIAFYLPFELAGALVKVPGIFFQYYVLEED